MGSEAIGIGTTLAYKSNGGYTTIARLKVIGDISLGDVDDVPYVCYDSADGFREHLAGIVDAGEFDITGVWTAAASQTGLVDLRGVIKDWRVVLPGALGQCDFKAYLSGPKLTPNLESEIEFSATVRITGPVEYT